PLHKQHRLKYEIQMIIQQNTLSEWMEVFSETEACVSPVLTFEEMTKDPQVLAREMIQHVNSETLKMKQIGIPIKLSETPGEIRTQAPKLGEHTEMFLHDIGTLWIGGGHKMNAFANDDE